MKKVLITLILLLFAQLSFSKTETMSYLLNREGGSDMYYDDVWIDCYIDRCELKCIGFGPLECYYWTASDCVGCFELCSRYEEGNGKELFDYADDQIDEGNYEGYYEGNIIIEPSGVTYYRNVTWAYDRLTTYTDMTIVITKVTP